MNSQAKQATPHSQLIAELLDSRVPKTEREHAAVREIERLRIERDEHARWRAKLADDLHDRETQVIELRRQLAEADLDAQRYRWIAGHCRSTSEHWGGRWSIIVDGPAPKAHDSEDAFDAAIDAQIEQERSEQGEEG